MARIWTRTHRYLAAVWLIAAALEVAVFELAKRRSDSWVLLLGAALFLVPLIATERTFNWLGRPSRRRWKRHDVEDELARAAKAARAAARGRG